MNIPQANPGAAYRRHQAEIDAAIHRVLDSGWYILGPEVEEFEKEFAAWIGVGFAIGVANGTEAIELALRAGKVGSGDAVFTVTNTAVATVAAIESCGALPVLVDVDADFKTMCPARLEEGIDRCLAEPDRYGRPRAIVPVHLFGQPADLPRLREIADRHDLLLVEDCAQAHGATLHGRPAGSWGNLASFSFYPTKNLGALGDGGAVVCNDAILAERVRVLRQYGWRDRYVSDVPGINSRLDELQAAVLRVKLTHLDAGNERRRAIASAYRAGIVAPGVLHPNEAPGASHVFHQYVVRTGARDSLQRHLASVGIGTAIHYPVPIHLQPGYRDRLPLVGSLDESERASHEILSLPMYPELTDEAVARVIEAVNSWSG